MAVPILNTQPLLPLLTWAGSKSRQTAIASRVEELYAPHRSKIWVEPFCGALGMTFQVLPKQAVLNDLNRKLIQFHQEVKTVNSCWDKSLSTLSYEELKNMFNNWDTVEQSRRLTLFYVVNRRSFNGIYRENSQGFFNVPEGRNSRGGEKKISYPNLEPYRKVMKPWVLLSLNFKSFLSSFLGVDNNIFIYADPPYDKQRKGHRYTKEGFQWSDQKELAEQLSKQKYPVVVSNAATDRMVELYEQHGFTIEFFYGKRSASANGDRTPAKEIIAHKNIDA